ncbi:MAG: hypothetical protein KDD62_04485 [Bdellovibrionales bacterium]|nr:hypothetical protein [Bdellovibrionales bacterium]
MQLDGMGVGLIAHYNLEAQQLIQDRTTHDLAVRLSELGAKVLVAPWQELATSDAHFVDNETRALIPCEDLKREASVVHVRDLGEFENQREAFNEFLKGLESLNVPICNSVPVLRQNLSKRYLLDFHEQGLPVAELTVVTSPEELMAWNDMHSNRFSDVVLKPLEFGELGKGVYRQSQLSQAQLSQLLDGGVPYIAQEYLPAIKYGEKRLVFVGRQLSHAVLKGILDDFKQSSKQSIVPYEPSTREIDIAMQVLDQLKDEVDVMRLDLVGSGKEVRIMEVELINPNLHEDACPAGEAYPQRFADYICARYFQEGR